jgi:proline dehydrogenase
MDEMAIDEIIKAMNGIVARLNEVGEASERIIAEAAECNQRYLEYLDDLLDNVPQTGENGVIVAVSGQKIKFNGADTMASWLAEVMK